MTALWAPEEGEADCVPLMPIAAESPSPPYGPLVLHLHGGGFGGCCTPDHAVPTILANAGATVFSAEYPTAPSHPFPKALQTLHATLNWIDRSGIRTHRSLFVAGEEAGANLTAGLTLMVRDQAGPSVAGQILISPMLDPRLGRLSVRSACAESINRRFAQGWQNYLGSCVSAGHPYATPLECSRLARLPPTLVITAEDDPLRDETLDYVERLRGSGVSVSFHLFPSPTGWPATLEQPVGPDSWWASEMRRLIADFFAQNSEPISKPRSRTVRLRQDAHPPRMG